MDVHAVVTGAGSGIGRAFADELATSGARVVCADIDTDAAQWTVQRIKRGGGRAVAAMCDVSRSEDVLNLFHVASRWFDHAPTLLINNAGIGAGGHTVGRASLAEWHRTIDVNLWGAIYGCHHFLPAMRANRNGGIINVASAAGFAAGPRMAAYNVSKAGVVSLSETLAAELSGSGVRVTVVCPTFVRTNIFAGEHIEATAASKGAQLAQVIGMSPERVASATLSAHRRGRLYVIPQPDARAIWWSKRFAPALHARAGGLVSRLAPFTPEES